MKNANRVGRVDVLRALAMLSVILSHAGSLSQRISMFCICFSVQLFFFISGLFASHGFEKDFKTMLVRVAKGYLVPHVVLSVINLISASKSYPDLWGYAPLQCFMAIRGQMLIAVLWFLPCLALTTLFYWALAKLFRKPVVRLVVCLVISLCFRIFKETSQWFWSFDSGLMFLFYYSLGDVLMPAFTGFSFRKLSVGRRLSVVSGLALCLALTVYSWFVYNTVEPSIFGLPYGLNTARIFTFAASASTIMVMCAVAYVLENVRFLAIAGRYTVLTFALNGIGETLMGRIMWTLGISWMVRTDWQTVPLCFARMLFTTFFISIPLYYVCPPAFGGRWRDSVFVRLREKSRARKAC